MIRLLQVVTPLHVGEGLAVGVIDLPVARERHTGWPFVPGASLKGALRARSSRRGDATDQVRAVFGSEPKDVSLCRGSLEVGAATLVALSVRSLAGTMVLITCPLALGRLSRGLVDTPEIPTPSVESVFVPRLEGFVVRELEKVVLEDTPFLGIKDPGVERWQDELRVWLGDEAPVKRLVVVHDDVFAYACEAWLPTRTRNEIDTNGVVKEHHLFTTEHVPIETLFAVQVSGDDDGLLPSAGTTFVLGGQATVGCGRVAWFERAQ